MTTTDRFASYIPLTFAGATGWFCDEGPGQRLPQLNFSIEEARASGRIIYRTTSKLPTVQT